MNTLPLTVADSVTMLRRNLRHARRYPAMTASSVVMPSVIMLLFVGVLGRTLRAGLGQAAPAGGYVDYVAPGIVVLTIASSCVATAVSVCVDMTSGMIDRFRTMPIARASLLTGHVLGSVIQTAISTVLVIAVALLLGFRPSGGVLDWLAAAGLLAFLAFALTWLAVLLGLLAKTPESASNTVLLIQFLPFLSSAFVPTNAMPAGVSWFAHNQPFTPVIETVRGLLLGSPIGNRAVLALAWCCVLSLGGYLAARGVFNRVRRS